MISIIVKLKMILSKTKIRNPLFQYPKGITVQKVQKRIIRKSDVYNNRVCNEVSSSLYFNIYENLNNRDAIMKHPESFAPLMRYISLVSLIKLLLKLFLSLPRFLLALQVLLFSVIIVKSLIHILVIVNPCADHVWVLLMEMYACGLTMQKNWLIVANLISGQSGRSIEKHLTPEVRVRTRLVHGYVGLEEFLNVEFIFLKHGIDFPLIVGIEDLLKVSSNSVLFIMEAIDVWATDCKHMLSKKFSHHTPKSLVNFHNIYL